MKLEKVKIDDLISPEYNPRQKPVLMSLDI